MKYSLFVFLTFFYCGIVCGQKDLSKEYFDQGLVLYNSGKSDEAIVFFTKSIELDTKNELAFYNRGMCFYAIQNYVAGLKDFKKAVRLKKNYTNGMIGQAVVLMGMNKNKKAIALLQKALKSDPTAFLAHYNLGIAYFNGGELKSASEQFDKTLQIRSDYPAALIYKGLIFFESGDHQAAIPFFDEAIKIDPTEGKAFFNRALAKLKSNYVSSACEDMKKAMELGYPEAESMYEKFPCKQ